MNKYICLLLFLFFIFSACQPTAGIPTPTFNITQEATFTPESTSTPEPTPTLYVPIPEVITNENIKNLGVIASINNIFMVDNLGTKGKIFFSNDDSKVFFIQRKNKISSFETDEWTKVDEKTSEDIQFLSQWSSLSPNQTWFSTTSAFERGFNLFDFNSLEKKYDFDLVSDRHSYQFSPDEKYFVAGGEDASIFLWNLEDGRRINVEMSHDYSGSDWNGWVGPVWVLKFSKDGSFLASGGNDQTVRLWRIPSGENFGVLYGHKMAVRGLEISDSGRYIASYGEENSFRLWDLQTQTTAGICEGHKPITKTGYSGNDYYLTGLKQVKISSDERYIVSQGKDETIRVWSIPDCSLLYSIENEELYFLSEDGSFFASIKDNVAMFRETENGELLFSIPDSSIVAISNDGKYIVAGLAGNSVQIWAVMQPGSTVPSMVSQPTVSPTPKFVETTFKIQKNLDPSEYPQNAKNFIVNEETSKEQLEIIWNSENSYYKERLAVYLEAIRLSYPNPDNFEPYISVYSSEGGSIEAWAFVMRDKSTGDFLVPAKKPDGSPYADLIVSPSENQDSLRLVRVSYPAHDGELRIIFDESKWPVIVTDSYSEWYNLGYAPIGWRGIHSPERDNLEEQVKKGIEISTDIEDLSSWPEITIEQLPEYHQLLKEYVKENKMFPENAINFGAYMLPKNDFLARIFFDYQKEPEVGIYRAYPETLPKRTFAYAILNWRIGYSNITKSILASQVWLDEENNPSIILNYISPCENNECPSKYFLKSKERLIKKDTELTPNYLIDVEDVLTLDADDIALYESQYLEILDVKDLLEKWVNDQKIPKELENKLLRFQDTMN